MCNLFITGLVVVLIIVISLRHFFLTEDKCVNLWARSETFHVLIARINCALSVARWRLHKKAGEARGWAACKMRVDARPSVAVLRENTTSNTDNIDFVDWPQELFISCGQHLFQQGTPLLHLIIKSGRITSKHFQYTNFTLEQAILRSFFSESYNTRQVLIPIFHSNSNTTYKPFSMVLLGLSEFAMH